MGSGYVADAIRTAHNADPNAKLYLNDYNIEGENAKSNRMYSLAQSLLAQGVPLNGIGFESHFIAGQVPSDLQANMQRFANLGLDVAVTELDDRVQLPATSGELQQQATDYGIIVKACLNVSRCVGVSRWGVGDGDSWIPGTFPGYGAATMYDNDYQPKPAFNAVVTALGVTSGDIVTVTNPGNQTGAVGTPISSLRIHATDSAAGQSLTYSANGLPPGLSISSSGLITGAQSGLCLDVTGASTANGAPVELWTCNGGTNQQWALG
jgi:endo-1,4-beta-xylanase